MSARDASLFFEPKEVQFIPYYADDKPIYITFHDLANLKSSAVSKLVQFGFPSLHSIMAAQGPKSMASFLLFLNLLMYAIVAAVAGWALNYGIDETAQSVTRLSPPARLFPIYYPIGNMATGFFVMFSLIAGLVGIAASLTGLQNVLQWHVAGVLSAAASSVIAWSLTLLAMGLACKEISIGWRPASLRTLETLTIILSGTQLLCTGAIHAGVTDTTRQSFYNTGRV